MKKKLMALAVVTAMLAVAVVGGTLAYFYDSDAQTNTFTTGNVKIDLWEDFDNDGDGLEKLLPATGSAQAGTLKNGVEKEVYITNDGSEDAYVRVHIAIPAILDDGDPTYNASANTLHWNFKKENIVDGEWNWTKSVGAEGESGYDAKDWNAYTVTIDQVDYNVYVATYETALKHDETTLNAIHQVYLDSKTTNENIDGIKKVLGDEWKIYVVAEGAQAAGFENAYDSLNASFGDPATAEGQVTAEEFKAAGEHRTLINLD